MVRVFGGWDGHTRREEMGEVGLCQAGVSGPVIELSLEIDPHQTRILYFVYISFSEHGRTANSLYGPH